MTNSRFAQYAAVPTEDGSLTLRHPIHGELFHSYSGAALEARDLYVRSSSIQEGWNRPGKIRVLDVGLGLGYNALATIHEYLQEPRACTLEVVSLEYEPELIALVASGDASWQKGWSSSWLEIVHVLRSDDKDRWHAAGVAWSWQVLCGNALDSPLIGPFDYIWQDPFSPEKNPSMWSADWFTKLRSVAQPHCELLSYSVSRTVKDALSDSGWQVKRLPTTTGKRHWLRATVSG